MPVKFVGQVDSKFVVAVVREHGGALLCFDQHAVDERIHLEQLEVGVLPHVL